MTALTVIQIALATLGGSRVGRADFAASRAPSSPGSPMTQLMRSTEELATCLRRQYPSWSPEADLQKSVARRLLDRSIDYREISQRALGSHWDRLTEADRTEFVTRQGHGATSRQDHGAR